MNMIYRILPHAEDGLPPTEVFNTPEQARDFFVVNYPDSKGFTLLACQPARLGDMLTEGILIGDIRERAAELNVDSDFTNDRDLMNELVLMLKAAANEFANLREVDINGYVTIKSDEIKIEKA